MHHFKFRELKHEEVPVLLLTLHTHLWARRYLYHVLLVTALCAVLVASCSLFNWNTQTGPIVTHHGASTTKVDPAIHAVEVDILDNIKTHGFNSEPDINDGLGGLWINWRYGTNPLQTNVNGTGETDAASGKPVRHDELTDLRYMHNLWSYKAQNPDDASFDSEIARYTPIIKHEFTNSHNERGWLYDEFMDIYHLSHDTFYQDTALSLVKSYAHAFDPKVGSIYKVSSAHPQGSYRVDLTLERGCALIQAGSLFNNARWVQEGTSIVNFVYTHAYIAQYHTFPAQVDNVLLPDGSINPQELFFLGRLKNYTVNGRLLQMGDISQMVISLLDTYQVTHKQDMLNKATDLLDPLSLPANTLGMWDTTYGGYYFSVNFEGNSSTQPGTVSIDKKRKEAGRQSIMLEAFHLADRFTNNRYKDMESRMLDVALHHIYNPAVHGVLYLVNADWTPPLFHNGTLNNMTTTEAMGAELESLFSLANA